MSEETVVSFGNGTRWQVTSLNFRHRGDEYGVGAPSFSSNRRSLHLILDLAGYEQMIAEQQRRGSLLNALHELVTRRDVLAGVPTENIAEAIKLLKSDNNSAASSARRDE